MKVRYSDFETITRSHTKTPPTCAAEEIAPRAAALLEKTAAGQRPVRLLGVTAHNLSETETQDDRPSPVTPTTSSRFLRVSPVAGRPIRRGEESTPRSTLLTSGIHLVI